MLHGELVVTHKRLSAEIEHGAVHVGSIDGVGAIQNHKSAFMLGGGSHRLTQRRDVGVKPSPDVLDVEHQRIDTFEHFERRSARFTIQTVDLESGLCICCIVDFGGIQYPFESMFGAEQGSQLQTGRTAE